LRFGLRTLYLNFVLAGGDAHVGADRHGRGGNRVVGSDDADGKTMRVLGQQGNLLSRIPKPSDGQHRFFLGYERIEIDRVASGWNDAGLKIVSVGQGQHFFHPARSGNYGLGTLQTGDDSLAIPFQPRGRGRFVSMDA
jgi:hypothetical protein